MAERVQSHSVGLISVRRRERHIRRIAEDDVVTVGHFREVVGRGDEYSTIPDSATSRQESLRCRVAMCGNQRTDRNVDRPEFLYVVHVTASC